MMLTSACNSNGTQEEASAPHSSEEPGHVQLTDFQYNVAGIELGKTSLRDLSDVVVANGLIDIPPQNLVSISAIMGGFVRKTELLQGMKVRKGQVLAMIENPDFIPLQQDYLETKSQLAYAKLDRQRQQELSTEQVNAQKTLQQAETLVQTLQARMLGMKERLRTAGIPLKTLESGKIVSQTAIVAPISGSVTTVNVNLGMYVRPTDVLFEIVDTDHLHVELSVFEKDIPKVQIGQKVRFHVSNNPEKEIQAEVYLINQMIDEDRTVRVHCHLENDAAGLLPKNYVKAVIETGTKPVNTLPENALVQFEGKDYIFIETVDKDRDSSKSSDKTFEMLEIQRGISEDGFTQITFPAGYDIKNTSIVIKGAYTLLSMLKNSESGHSH
ncbi:cobalt-zinc-cadmium efflux system membrane fusion protein [Dyadobacter jejuensis]|uniref:Cobalt-zinc-cadmium efflux system membrane fusion protein n=2 Tax=Dyadobacter jejuensis TaxID=1082580 RepID=A0A316ACV3_9BACT|nr:cobalt-zinc-cadmium efflux system membrane fusion protein [Dyadobacter jejuensis]